VNVRHAVLSVGLQYRVEHRLPGRLRVVVPALTRVPERRRRDVARHLSHARWPSGITQVTPGFVTGSVLIRYRHEVVSEPDVLGWIDEIVCGVRKTVVQLLSLPEQRRPEAARWLGERLTRALRNGAVVGAELIGVAGVRSA